MKIKQKYDMFNSRNLILKRPDTVRVREAFYFHPVVGAEIYFILYSYSKSTLSVTFMS